MKLIYCTKCDSVVRLIKKHRQCECGHCGGRYIDEINVKYYGKQGIKLGFDNNSFAIRIRGKSDENILYNMRKGKGFDDSTFEAFVIDCYGGCAKTFVRVNKKDY